MKKYYYKSKLIGIKITKFSKGSIPQTDPKEPLGILTFKHLKGAYFPPHIHKPIKRTTPHLQECFIVRKGKIRITLYGPHKKYLKSLFLSEGQAFLTISGGHEIKVIKDCEMFEVKNGPYKADKVFI